MRKLQKYVRSYYNNNINFHLNFHRVFTLYKLNNSTTNYSHRQFPPLLHFFLPFNYLIRILSKLPNQIPSSRKFFISIKRNLINQKPRSIWRFSTSRRIPSINYIRKKKKEGKEIVDFFFKSILKLYLSPSTTFFFHFVSASLCTCTQSNELNKELPRNNF